MTSKQQKFTLGMLVVGILVYCIADCFEPWPAGFLAKYPRYKGPGAQRTFHRPNKVFGQEGGLETFTFKGDWRQVLLEAREHLVGAGWKQHGTMFVSNQGEEVRIYQGKSVYAPDPYYKWKGRPMFNRFVIGEINAKKSFGVDPDTVRSWITIDHHWNGNEGSLDGLLRRFVRP